MVSPACLVVQLGAAGGSYALPGYSANLLVASTNAMVNLVTLLKGAASHIDEEGSS